MQLSINNVRELMFFIEACKTVADSEEKWVPNEKIWGIIEEALDKISKNEGSASFPQHFQPTHNNNFHQSAFGTSSPITIVDDAPLLSSPGSLGGFDGIVQHDTFITNEQVPGEIRGSTDNVQTRTHNFDPAHDSIPGIGSK